jgi:hypothetical protein
MRISIQNLQDDISQKQLEVAFGHLGAIELCRERWGLVAYVELKSDVDVRLAVRSLRGVHFLGRHINVAQVRPRPASEGLHF